MGPSLVDGADGAGPICSYRIYQGRNANVNPPSLISGLRGEANFSSNLSLKLESAHVSFTWLSRRGESGVTFSLFVRAIEGAPC